MGPDELDDFLRKPTEHELLYQKGLKKPGMQSGMKPVTVNGQTLLVCFLSEKTLALSGGRHSRYNAYPVHIHPWVELNYMYSGSCIQKINGKPVELKQGQTLLLDLQTIHEIPVLEDEQILLNIFIRKEYLNASFFNRFSHKNIVSQFLINCITEGLAHDNYIFFPSENSRRLPIFIQEFFCELFDPSECAEDIKSSLFSLILTELIDICRHAAAAQVLQPKGDLVLPVLKYIEDHYQTLTLQELSALFCLNPDYLSRLLKNRTGQSFQALVTSQRMSVAKQLLTNSSLSIEEIAHQAGYQNVTFFYKKFTDICGCTPGKYRKARQS